MDLWHKYAQQELTSIYVSFEIIYYYDLLFIIQPIFKNECFKDLFVNTYQRCRIDFVT